MSIVRRLLARAPRRLHQLYDARPGTCWACGKSWPCATWRAGTKADQ